MERAKQIIVTKCSLLLKFGLLYSWNTEGNIALNLEDFPVHLRLKPLPSIINEADQGDWSSVNPCSQAVNIVKCRFCSEVADLVLFHQYSACRLHC